MKQNKLTTRQMINIELAERATNKSTAKKLKHHIPEEEQEGLKIEFNCECSDPSCEQKIALTLKQYEALHKNFSHFVIVKGHNVPQVEKVKASTENISLVEKYSLS